MNYSHQSRVGDVADIGLGIVAPDGKDGMRSHAEQFAQAGIPFIFDPGQGMTLFDGPELLAMIEQAHYVAVNDYEGRMLAERTGIPISVVLLASTTTVTYCWSSARQCESSWTSASIVSSPTANS